MSVLPALYANMDCGDWKLRCEAVGDLRELVLAHPDAVTGKRAGKVIDSLVSRLGDGNSKVNALALEATNDILQAIPNAFKAQLHIMVRRRQVTQITALLRYLAFNKYLYETQY